MAKERLLLFVSASRCCLIRQSHGFYLFLDVLLKVQTILEYEYVYECA